MWSSVIAYRPRPIQFLGVSHVRDWRLKTYGISATPREFSADDLVAALRLVDQALHREQEPFWAAGIDWNALPRYGVGTLILHEGADAWFVILCTWFGINMFTTEVWAAPSANPTAFEPLAGSHVTMCVWEQAVMEHERAAWLRHVFRESGDSDWAAYLGDGLTAVI
jgi:hypothetical protein